MCYGLNKYCNNISIKSSYFFCILKQNPFILALALNLQQALEIYIVFSHKIVTDKIA